MRPYSAFGHLAIVAIGTFILTAAGCSTPSEREQKVAGTAAAADEKPEPMSSSNILFVIETINLGEAEQAELALQHSQNEEVTELARRILQDHTASTQVVNELGQGMGTEEGASSSISDGIQFQANAFLEDMAGLTGYEFNKTYLEKQVVLHGVALDVVRTQLIPNADERQVLDYLEKYHNMLEAHRKQAQQSLKKILESRDS
ncbi:DUF4142 domain-containing protein [Modicisalibacter luteus]|uniref:DUF4142 domain-containing protein n=1 Tax=Modicisalibacter luteus TaxID=453962 RepID=A0ABV7M245_9GAMM|nr:DUF4142 domain-containing protein [Halomonas lutea]GHA83171.1 hypothetical protein GCM10007159_00070 [Halomonas lutea]